MCHLVTWKVIPKTDAERARIESEEYTDGQMSDGDIRTGLERAVQRAEDLVLSGFTEVKVWSKVGEASKVSSVQWEKTA